MVKTSFWLTGWKRILITKIFVLLVTWRLSVPFHVSPATELVSNNFILTFSLFPFIFEKFELSTRFKKSDSWIWGPSSEICNARIRILVLRTTLTYTPTHKDSLVTETSHRDVFGALYNLYLFERAKFCASPRLEIRSISQKALKWYGVQVWTD